MNTPTPTGALRDAANAIHSVIAALTEYDDTNTQVILEDLWKSAAGLDHLHNGTTAAELAERRVST